jgi:peptidoglycan/LPS O-acetylase OafA/YrhL/lysophospholipase L1-like esterase
VYVERPPSWRSDWCRWLPCSSRWKYRAGLIYPTWVAAGNLGTGNRDGGRAEGASRVTRQGERGTGLKHIPALDGLRGMAVAGVLLFHAGHLIGGYLGVDLFFVLSGFLITSLLLDERQRTGGIRLGAFWARRARRLLPALVAMLLGVSLYALIFAAPAELNQIRGDALATLAYVANWRAIFGGTSYFAQFSAPSPLSHTWSLAIEEQFYLIWPLAVFGLLRWRRGSVRVLLASSLSLAAVSAGLMALLYVPGADPSRVYMGTDTRAQSLLLGAALAAFIAWRGPLRSRTAGAALEAGGWAAVAGLAWAWTQVNGETSAGLYRGGFALCGLAVVCVIASVSRPEPGLLARVFSVQPLRALGIISYGVYLWHWPVYVLFDPQRTHLGDWPLTAVRIGITLTVATISFYVLELPIRTGTLRTWPVQVWGPAAAVATAAVVLITTVGGAPTVAAATLGRDPLSATPAPPGWSKVVVVGDSIAASLAAGMKTDDALFRVEVLNRAISGCKLTKWTESEDLSGRLINPPQCGTGWAGDINESTPDWVIFSVYGGDWNITKDPPCTPAYDDQYRATLRAAVATLGSRRAKVAILTSPYPTIYTGLPARAVRQRVDCVNAIYRSVAKAMHATVVDLAGYVCPGGSCRVTDGSQPLRPDGVHFSIAAGASVGSWILTQTVGAR